MIVTLLRDQCCLYSGVEATIKSTGWYYTMGFWCEYSIWYIRSANKIDRSIIQHDFQSCFWHLRFSRFYSVLICLNQLHVVQLVLWGDKSLLSSTIENMFLTWKVITSVSSCDALSNVISEYCFKRFSVPAALWLKFLQKRFLFWYLQLLAALKRLRLRQNWQW